MLKPYESIKNNNEQKAFTLAEVLITLSIIGVVAAMTVPALQKNLQRTQYDSALRKIYAELSQAAIMLRNDEGGTLKGAFTGNSSDEKGQTARNKFAKYLKFTKICGPNKQNFENCWASQDEHMHRYDTGAYASWWPTNSYGMRLASGMNVVFYHFYNTDCSSGVVLGNVTPNEGVCGSIMIDVNGNKGPNRKGYDIYDFVLYPEGLKPNGDGTKCNSEGNECSSYYLVN